MVVIDPFAGGSVDAVWALCGDNAVPGIVYVALLLG